MDEEDGESTSLRFQRDNRTVSLSVRSTVTDSENGSKGPNTEVETGSESESEG